MCSTGGLPFPEVANPLGEIRRFRPAGHPTLLAASAGTKGQELRCNRAEDGIARFRCARHPGLMHCFLLGGNGRAGEIRTHATELVPDLQTGAFDRLATARKWLPRHGSNVRPPH